MQTPSGAASVTFSVKTQLLEDRLAPPPAPAHWNQSRKLTLLLTGRMTDVTASCQAPEVGDRLSLRREASGWTAHDSFRVSVTAVWVQNDPRHLQQEACTQSLVQQSLLHFRKEVGPLSGWAMASSKPLALVNRFIGKFIISQSGQLTPVCKRTKSSNINSHKQVKASLYHLTSLQLHINSVKQQFAITY